MTECDPGCFCAQGALGNVGDISDGCNWGKCYWQRWVEAQDTGQPPAAKSCPRQVMRHQVKSNATQEKILLNYDDFTKKRLLSQER